VGHPLLESSKKSKVELSNVIYKDKKIISIFPGSRNSEVNILMPILINFIELMNKKFSKYVFIFHATEENKNIILGKLKNNNLDNIEVFSDENIKSELLSKSIFAVVKSGTISLLCSRFFSPFPHGTVTLSVI